jgi:hypothetical protein
MVWYHHNDEFMQRGLSGLTRESLFVTLLSESTLSQSGLELEQLIYLAVKPFSFRAAWAAARRAIGTRKGEQET